MNDRYINWHHCPAHLFKPGAVYIVTAGTFRKQKYFHTAERLDIVLTKLFEMAARYEWELQAWAVLANHYHFVAQAPESSSNLKQLIQAIHSQTAKRINTADHCSGRKVWYQYWDTCLTNESSYLARLHYVHMNPVKHGIVESAEDYRWCSMRWLLERADAAFRKRILSAKCDSISITDDF